MSWSRYIANFVFVVFLFGGWGAQKLSGQDQYDFKSWNAIVLEKKISDRWKSSIRNQFRFDSNITEFDRYIAEVGFSYNLFKRYRIDYGLRYLLKWDNQGSNQGLRSFMRYNWDFSYRYKVNRTKISYRYRFQRQHELGKDELEGDFPGIDHRVKMKVAYNIRKWKWDPFISGEVFYHKQRASYSGVDKYRFILGTEHDWDANGKLKIQLANDLQSRVWQPDVDFILMLAWEYRL